MNFNTYYINLEACTERNNKMVQMLTQSKVSFSRYNALFFDTNKLNPEISMLGKLFCPFSALGCGLSHWLLIKHIFNHDHHDFALILEDDVKPLSPEFAALIMRKINTYPEDWDIIKLHHDGFSYNNSIYLGKFVNGSTAAYLISRQGMAKILKYKLSYHLDWQYWWWHQIKKINMYKWETPLFTTTCNDSSIRKNNRFIERFFSYQFASFKPLYFYILTPGIRVPFFNIEINLLHIFIFLLIVFFLL